MRSAEWQWIIRYTAILRSILRMRSFVFCTFDATHFVVCCPFVCLSVCHFYAVQCSTVRRERHDAYGSVARVVIDSWVSCHVWVIIIDTFAVNVDVVSGPVPLRGRFDD